MPARLSAYAVLLALTLAPFQAVAQTLTLTDTQGRSIKADVISVTDTQVKIKRDDGQLFDLPLKNLNATTQAELKAWAKLNPDSDVKPRLEVPVFIPTEKSITLTVNRGKFDVDVTYKSDYYQGGYEEWGYSIQLTNTTMYPLDNLRVEYNIFGRRYAGSDQTVQTGRQVLEGLGSKKSTVFRTKTFRIRKSKSADSKAYGGELAGIWTRLYYGDTLIQEYSAPEGLKTKVKWAQIED